MPSANMKQQKLHFFLIPPKRHIGRLLLVPSIVYHLALIKWIQFQQTIHARTLLKASFCDESMKKKKYGSFSKSFLESAISKNNQPTNKHLEILIARCRSSSWKHFSFGLGSWNPSFQVARMFQSQIKLLLIRDNSSDLSSSAYKF